MGAKVVTLSGPDGYIYDPDGVTTKEKIDYIVEMRASGRNQVKDYADKFGVASIRVRSLGSEGGCMHAVRDGK